MKMVTLESPGGERVCVQRGQAKTMSSAAIAALGYAGWSVVAELDDMPVEELTPDEIEAARLNCLSRAEYLAEVAAVATGQIASPLSSPKPNG